MRDSSNITLPYEQMALEETYGQAIRQLKKEKEECPTACGPGFKCKKGTCEPEKQKGGGGQNSAPGKCPILSTKLAPAATYHPLTHSIHLQITAASTGECPCSGDKQCKKNKCVCNDRHATGDDCHCRDGYEEVNGKCERKIVGKCSILSTKLAPAATQHQLTHTIPPQITAASTGECEIDTDCPVG